MPCGVGRGYPPELSWALQFGSRSNGSSTGGVKGSGGRAKGFGSGGVGGKGTDPRDGANFATCLLFLTYKKAFFEGCPVGWGGYPPELAWWTGG